MLFTAVIGKYKKQKKTLHFTNYLQAKKKTKKQKNTL